MLCLFRAADEFGAQRTARHAQARNYYEHRHQQKENHLSRIRLGHVGHLLHHRGVLKRGILHLLEQRLAGMAGERVGQLLRSEHDR